MDGLTKFELNDIFATEPGTFTPRALNEKEWPADLPEPAMTPEQGIRKLVGEELHKSPVSAFSWNETVSTHSENGPVKDFSKRSSARGQIRMERVTIDGSDFIFGYDHTGKKVYEKWIVGAA